MLGPAIKADMYTRLLKRSRQKAVTLFVLTLQRQIEAENSHRFTLAFIYSTFLLRFVYTCGGRCLQEHASQSAAVSHFDETF